MPDPETQRPASIPFFSLERQVEALRGEALDAIGSVLDECAFAGGSAVARFESELERYLGVRHVVAVNSGTSALHAALLCANLKAGDEVITVAHTWISTVWAARYVGALPRFVDVDPATCGMDPSQVERALSPRTRAILPVHLYGRPVDLAPILEIGDQHGVTVVEDFAQAMGAKYRKRHVGTFGLVSATSFYPGKNLGAFGEGGALVTDDTAIARRAARLRDHAQDGRHNHIELGFNWRMDGIQAAVLSMKLRRLDAWNARRRELARGYYEGLRGAPGLRLLPEDVEDYSTWHVFPAFHSRRDALRAALDARGISTAVHYPRPVHLQPAFAYLGLAEGTLPITERLAATQLSLPMFPELTTDELDAVVEAVVDACREVT